MKTKFLMLSSMCLTVAITWTVLSFTQSLLAGEGATKQATEAKAGASEQPLSVVESETNGEYGLLAIGVGLTVLGGAIGTGLAQKGIGTAVVAACSENRGFLGTGVFLLALPETILIIATGIAYLLLQHIQ